MSATVVSNDIVQGQRGSVAKTSVGVAWVAPDAGSAQIIISGTSGGANWEIRCEVRMNDIVPMGTALIPIAKITAPHGSSHGSVSFGQPADNIGTVPPEVVMLPAGGRLRVDGPSVMTATDVSVAAWKPDEQKPATASVEWLPAKYARENTAPEDITRLDMKAGDSAAIGKNQVTVAAIQGASGRHPAWIVMRLAHR